MRISTSFGNTASLCCEGRFGKWDIEAVVEDFAVHRALETDQQVAEARVGGLGMFRAAIGAEKW